MSGRTLIGAALRGLLLGTCGCLLTLGIVVFSLLPFAGYAHVWLLPWWLLLFLWLLLWWLLVRLVPQRWSRDW